ncbi:MAG: hypothetical protein M0R02_13750, partial [Bacteroidales bacterium]|nr:hypothetical protein [Bacteroidales bacterium]
MVEDMNMAAITGNGQDLHQAIAIEVRHRRACQSTHGNRCVYPDRLPRITAHGHQVICCGMENQIGNIAAVDK